MGIGYQLYSRESLFLLKLPFLGIQVEIVVVLGTQVLVSSNHKTECTSSRVVPTLTNDRHRKLHHHIDKRTRGEILTGSTLLFRCILFQQAFINVAHHITVVFFVPIQLVYGLNNGIEVDRLTQTGRSIPIDFLDAITGGLGTDIGQEVTIKGKSLAIVLLVDKHSPTVFFRNFRLETFDFRKFQEKDISQFIQILMISNPVITKYITLIPKFGCYAFCCHFSIIVLCSQQVGVDDFQHFIQLVIKYLIQSVISTCFLERFLIQVFLS